MVKAELREGNRGKQPLWPQAPGPGEKGKKPAPPAGLSGAVSGLPEVGL